MTKFEFETTDFILDEYKNPPAHIAAKIANAKIAPLLERLNEFESMIENAPTFYGQKDWDGAFWSKIKEDIDTHKAKLVCIEEIK